MQPARPHRALRRWMRQHRQQSAAGTGLPPHTYPGQSQRTLKGMQHMALVFRWKLELRFGSAGHFRQMVPLGQELQAEQARGFGHSHPVSVAETLEGQDKQQALTGPLQVGAAGLGASIAAAQAKLLREHQ